jgi:UDP-glucose 4-epimerase
VADAVQAIAVMAATDSTIGDVYNVGGTGEVTIKQLAEQVLSVTESKSEITYTPYSDAYPAGFEDIQRRVPDISKVKGAIGWAPTKDLRQIISDIAAH